MQEVKIDLFEGWGIIKKHKRSIAKFAIAVTIIVMIISLVQTKIYESTSNIMPMSGPAGSGLQALASQFTGMSALGGLLGMSSGYSPANHFMNLLKSRKAAKKVIDELGLMKDFYKKKWDSTNNRWQDGFDENVMYMAAVNRLMSSVMRFKNDEQTGMLVVTAAYPNPDMAAKIANAYVDILQDIINENSNQVAKKDRIFIDEQLAKRKIEYLKVAKELSKFYGVGRVSNVKSSLDVQVPLKGDDGVYEGDILSILEEKEKELAGKLEQVEVVEDVPQQVYLQYLTLRKELLQQMCSLLAQQVEVTKIKELEKTLSFQIVDSAEPPLQRSKPKRKQMVMFALIGSVFVGMAAAILYEYVKKVRNQQ